MKKVERGMCAYKFGETGECPWGAKCMYTHDIPPEIMKDPVVRQNQTTKLKEVKKKQEGRMVPAKPHAQKSPKSQKVEGGTSRGEDGRLECQNNKPNNNQKRMNPKTEENQEKVAAVVGGDNLSVDPFLELIRPMIMDQMQKFMESQQSMIQQSLKEIVSGQMSQMTELTFV